MVKISYFQKSKMGSWLSLCQRDKEAAGWTTAFWQFSVKKVNSSTRWGEIKQCTWQQRQEKESKTFRRRSSARRTQHPWKTLNSPQKGMRKCMVQSGIGSFPQSSKSLAKSLCKACLCAFIKQRLFVMQAPKAKLRSSLFCMSVISQICWQEALLE